MARSVDQLQGRGKLRFMSTCVAFGVTRTGDDLFGINDDRFLIDRDASVFAVADAAGPTYGGHHAPLGVELGLAAIARALAPAQHRHACSESCIRAAFDAANAEM